jgi:hypothetical protein
MLRAAAAATVTSGGTSPSAATAIGAVPPTAPLRVPSTTITVEALSASTFAAATTAQLATSITNVLEALQTANQFEEF